MRAYVGRFGGEQLMEETKIEVNFEVIMNKEVKEQIEWLINNYEKEIGAWLLGKIESEKIIIDGILFPEQEVDSASVDTNSKALIKLMKEHKEDCQKIIGHWHSHNTMSAFWSATDETFIEQYTAPRGMAVFIVSSQKDGHRVRLEMYKPIKISIDEIELKSEIDDNSELSQKMKEIIETKVKESKPVYQQTFWEDKYNNEYQLEEVKTKKNKVIIENVDANTSSYVEAVFPNSSTTHYLPNGRCTIVYDTENRSTAEKLAEEIEDYLFWGRRNGGSY